jgi:membrane-bound lytic murein transglycosylase MltF
MIGALAYQESRIDQSMRSPAGAVGIMQVLPSTAADPNVNIPNIEEAEPNIHAGVKYLHFIRDRYFEGEPMDDLNKMLFSFASYNAGPARVAGLRKRAGKAGLDPNVWFRNVEIVAGKQIGRETVQYVGNIYKYYTAYRLMVDKLESREKAKKSPSPESSPKN